jgi:hypothetical protein
MVKKGKGKLKMRAKKAKDDENKEEEEPKVSGDDYVEPFYGLIKI